MEAKSEANSQKGEQVFIAETVQKMVAEMMMIQNRAATTTKTERIIHSMDSDLWPLFRLPVWRRDSPDVSATGASTVAAAAATVPVDEEETGWRLACSTQMAKCSLLDG